MSAKANAPIIIKRKKVIAGGGHHGGAWKVAINYSFDRRRFCAKLNLVPEIQSQRCRSDGYGNMAIRQPCHLIRCPATVNFKC